MNIEWKEVNPDYIVSSEGQVMSRKSGKLKMLKPIPDSGGYPFVGIYFGGAKRLRPVHQLVAEAFLGPRPTPSHEVNHKNGVRLDNRDHNLEWVTKSGNQQHSLHVLGNKAKMPRGEAHHKAKFTVTDVREILQRCAAGETQTRVAADYGVRQQAVSEIVTGRNWAWLR